MLTSCYTKNQAIRKFCVPLIKDTIITINDSVQVPISQVDTVFLQQHSDTVVVENDSVRVEYIRYRDTIYLRGTAKPRTVYITKKVPVRLTQPCPPAKEPPWWHTYIIALFLFLALWFAASIALLSVTRR
jgi:hypothetical protein